MAQSPVKGASNGPTNQKEQQEPKPQMTEAEMLQKLKDLQKENEALKAKPSGSSGMSGWLIQTKNQAYEGKTMGINFRGGRAFVRLDPKDPEQENKVARFETDFDYKVEFVEDFSKLPPVTQDGMQSSMIDVLQQPAIR